MRIKRVYVTCASRPRHVRVTSTIDREIERCIEGTKGGLIDRPIEESTDREIDRPIEGSREEVNEVSGAPSTVGYLAEIPQGDCPPTPEETDQLERRNRLRRIQNKPEVTIGELRLQLSQIAA